MVAMVSTYGWVLQRYVRYGWVCVVGSGGSSFQETASKMGGGREACQRNKERDGREGRAETGGGHQVFRGSRRELLIIIVLLLAEGVMASMGPFGLGGQVGDNILVMAMVDNILVMAMVDNILVMAISYGHRLATPHW